MLPLLGAAGSGGLSASTNDSGSAISGISNTIGGINSPAIGAKSSWIPLAIGGGILLLVVVLLTRGK